MKRRESIIESETPSFFQGVFGVNLRTEDVYRVFKVYSKVIAPIALRAVWATRVGPFSSSVISVFTPQSDWQHAFNSRPSIQRRCFPLFAQPDLLRQIQSKGRAFAHLFQTALISTVPVPTKHLIYFNASTHQASEERGRLSITNILHSSARASLLECAFCSLYSFGYYCTLCCQVC
jgi:hypothetical protein